MDEKQFDKNTWQTSKWFVRWLELRFCWFHIDGSSNGLNALTTFWIGPAAEGLDDDTLSGQVADDFLSDDLFERLIDFVADQGELLRIFVNPPYSDPLPFVKRAAELKRAGHLVVMLLPADKSVEWYEVIQENASEVIDIIGYRDEKGKFHSGRIHFVNPITGEEVKGNNKGSMVAVFDPTMQDFVTRTVSLDFVKKVGGYDL
ncbi:DNA N-6-adenine-methyltransferase [Actinobacillus pleuropneumoniae]|uniref:DNA N-6-adenine-methyltransferase n=1 Tax=Actinobacillus pleuropneumoniae TaxID=715 RepID=UPI0000397D68|nr:DNA N-6-adenine-methyltransferase [Actinobacillus pleuropneumoniae]UKH11277.1 adenine methyltransferase [Actinobacillus pleuropneumoniae]